MDFIHRACWHFACAGTTKHLCKPGRVPDKCPQVLFTDYEADSFAVINTKTRLAVLKELLEEEQHVITRAYNGNDAVIQAKKNKFDIVLMDIKMPRKSGYEAIKQIRTFDKITPIVAVTAFAFNSDEVKAYKAGFNDYLTKPIDFEKLKLVLRKHIN